ncbi:hypothetical protein [Streptococcus mitis]|jgi:hypothetical protein|uniref:Uncharacterized protein n=1 Tax=Streptococcus mitis TaxID=28037 RepID=A0A1X1K5Z7_STRMT|nr:hypothetical protein [Streptococcus mitis]ORO94779.1 hypothetical protein B7698_05920 [Streptococcus mitis]
MNSAVFCGRFDNGHDYYDAHASVVIDDKKKELDAEEICKIADALRRYHRGTCVDIYVDGSEIEWHTDCGNAYYAEDGSLVVKEGFEWLNWSCSADEIAEAYHAMEESEEIA